MLDVVVEAVVLEGFEAEDEGREGGFYFLDFGKILLVNNVKFNTRRIHLLLINLLKLVGVHGANRDIDGYVAVDLLDLSLCHDHFDLLPLGVLLDLDHLGVEVRRTKKNNMKDSTQETAEQRAEHVHQLVQRSYSFTLMHELLLQVLLKAWLNNANGRIEASTRDARGYLVASEKCDAEGHRINCGLIRAILETYLDEVAHIEKGHKHLNHEDLRKDVAVVVAALDGAQQVEVVD